MDFGGKYFLTTLLIIDIWERYFPERRNDPKVQRKKEVVTESIAFWTNFFTPEGGDYEGVQSFSQRR